jgi:hypothetical protein
MVEYAPFSFFKLTLQWIKLFTIGLDGKKQGILKEGGSGQLTPLH